MMNKILSKILMLAVLLLAGTALTSCTHSDDPAPEPQPSGPKTYTLTIKASKSSDTALTRALSEVDGTTEGSKKIVSKWTADDVVSVYKDETLLGTLTATNVSADGNSCDLEGSLTTAPRKNDELTLKYLSPSYNTQDGTLTGTDHSIDKTCDYSTATVTVKSVESVDATHHNITVNESPATFTNQQAIVQFTFKEFSDGTTLLSPSSLTIDYGTGSVTLTDIPNDTYTTNGSGVLYVAIPGFSDQTLQLTAIVDSKTYYYEKSGVTFENGTYRRISLKMFNPFTVPLTLECCENATDIEVAYYGDLEYRIDGGDWYSWSSHSTETQSLSKGQKVSFRGTNATSTTHSDPMTITCNKDCYVYGNVMSLLDTDVADYATMETLPYSGTFQALFKDQPITNKDGKDLVLPATTLVERCYSEMFSGCTKLNHIVCLATNTSADYCTYNWVSNAGTDESLNGTTKTFVVNSSMTINDPMNPTTSTVNNGTEPLWSRGDSGIPIGWTVTK